MDFGDIETRGLVLLGCGKMGSALLQGWLAAGLSVSSVTVIEPNPSPWLMGTGVTVTTDLPPSPAVVVIAVKPQMVAEALPVLFAMGGGDTLFLSIAAGTTLKTFEAMLGETSPVIRAMPNTPAAVGRGITALIGNSVVSHDALNLGEKLMSVVGQTVRLEREADMDAVTAVSGSGPAYVFHMIETLAEAGKAEGLAPDLAMTLARATVAGAGALAEAAEETPEQLRVNVTSPKGTTAAALDVLMDEIDGLPSLMRRAVAAAAERSRELGK